MIFLAFANDRSNPLPTLSKEEDEIFRLLSIRSAKHHFLLNRDAHITLAKTAEYLIRFKDDLTVFHFSGHAGRDNLIMEDQSVNSTGIADLLGKCPKLKVVILNGCSTAGQIKTLLNLPSKPAVIATSSPVDDFAATQFSISFFQALSEQYATLEEAFNIGLSAAKAATNRSLFTRNLRQIAFRDGLPADIWLIEASEGAEDKLSWKLPGMPILPDFNEIEPNQFLMKGLLQSLAAFDPQVKEVLANKYSTEKERGFRRLNSGKNRERNVILKCLPLPISEQIAKLVTKDRGNNYVFYNSFSYDRLKQILQTYDLSMELPVFILLAQLFDLVANEKLEAKIKDEQKEAVENYLKTPYYQRIRRMYLPMIRLVSGILSQNGIPLFVPEIADLNSEVDQDFKNTIQALELKKERLSDMKGYDRVQIIRECVEAEEMLTFLLGKLSFLASYSLVSIRNIDVLRNRLFRTPSFVHRVVHLTKKDDGEPEEVEELLDDFLDSESVLLMKKQQMTGKTSFLNLTPFVIDENAYIKKADNIKLHFFHHFQEDTGTYYFMHTYKPEDPLLEILKKETEDADEMAIQDVWDQFEDFRELIESAPQ